MPLYDYKCGCGHIVTEMNTIDDRNVKAPIHCGQKMSIMITGSHHIAPVLGGGGFPGYKCPVTDKFVTSRKERRNIMAENNLVETS